MKKVLLVGLLCLFCAGTANAQTKRTLTLEDVIELARKNSRSAKLAETQRNLGYWSYRVYRSQLKPQLLVRGTLPSYINRSTPVEQNNGDIDFIEVNQNNSNISLGLEQVLPWTNTTIAFESALARFDNYAQDFSNYQGDPVGITITQPLFQVNPFKWDRQIEPLRYEQSKREFVQDLEDASRQAAAMFFQLLVEQKNLEIALQNESANDTINKVEQGRFNIGTTTEDKVLQTEADLLTAQSQAQQARLDVQSRSLALRNFIGLTDDVELELVPPADAPDFTIEYETALKYAKENRSEFLDFQLDRLEVEQQMAQARAQRFSANLSASYGYNSNQTDNLGDVYNPDNLASGGTFRLTFGIPILDGGRNRARMNQARERMQLTEFTIEQNRINFEQEIANAVRNFGQIRNQIEIAEKRQEIALKRFEITNGRYLAGKVDILDLTNARTSKDESIRSYISALQQYWDAYYELRNLTLYDFRNGELLYNPLLEYDPKTDSVIQREDQ
ncbi:outer membrane protein TolC [Roseivirga pacifica]|uniref:Outer membrane protein TolC n=1 Tax=Roseivirga pacifica TaxID=1267423 RepID=A0A1I0RPY6_9BACT|nr:TolC family protein [Roseivirga pacifica]RKQ50004.1 outer membrane protein TolC [Roseivirga pacifica]SEW43272.1 Outer membrane protein TolC [Roseivirga pacifica]